MPHLSIITVCLNDKDGLEKTIRSVIGQTFTDYEFIIIDGGSTDGSDELIIQYSSGISYWVSEKDKGIFNAMNKGLAKARGEYCLFLNSGDYLVNEKIFKRVFSEDRKEDILYGDMMIDKGVGKLIYGAQPGTITFEFMIETTVWHPVSFIKRQLFEKLGYYNEDLKIISDYEFFLRAIILEKCSTFHVPFAVSVFNTMGIGSSSEYNHLHQQERRLVQEKYLDANAIAAAQKYNSLKKSKAVILSDWINRHAVLRRTSLFLYSNFKWMRKLF